MTGIHRAPKTPGSQRPPLKPGKVGNLAVQDAMKAADPCTQQPAPLAPTPQGGAGS